MEISHVDYFVSLAFFYSEFKKSNRKTNHNFCRLLFSFVFRYKTKNLLILLFELRGEWACVQQDIRDAIKEMLENGIKMDLFFFVLFVWNGEKKGYE